MKRVATVLAAVVVASLAVWRQAKVEQLVAEQRHAIADLQREMEFQAVCLAQRDVLREDRRRIAEASVLPAEVASLRAQQRRSKRDGASVRMFSLQRLRDAYDSVWADYHASGKWTALSGGGTAAK